MTEPASIIEDGKAIGYTTKQKRGSSSQGSFRGEKQSKGRVAIAPKIQAKLANKAVSAIHNGFKVVLNFCT